MTTRQHICPNAIAAGRITVEVEGVLDPVTFDHLSDALTALWEALRVLPLRSVEANAYELLLTRPDRVEIVAGFLEPDGSCELPFGMNGHRHRVRIRLAEPEAARCPALRGTC
ncbi:hypothetical protein [Kitasatospora sp. McL0602]|uniref:hypothetical protein n=1 Tax=Kitasatospora sp. McL0602 TaxID=3439530 RepID=UPI003F8AFDFA